ncbi:hypothetical protein [Pedobacter namyangjuensis]|uniref:hypothetical protein n=1 Tax=Pedobacter namyangjuensis TaxID=600626 RepID=UPI000DE1EA12|nr:hypothetical protein [Pedobacter namyangjuensis]
MASTKHMRSSRLFQQALSLEKSGDLPVALKRYQQAVSADPANAKAWNRQMILYRKSKTPLQEAKLIKTAISAYQKAIRTEHQSWLEQNREKADSSRELAGVLGLLEADGTPVKEDPSIEKWQTRLYLLEYRIKSARKKKGRKPVPKTATSRRQGAQKTRSK